MSEIQMLAETLSEELTAINKTLKELLKQIDVYSKIKDIVVLDFFYAKDAHKWCEELFKQGYKLLAITQDGTTTEGISTRYTFGR